MTIHETCILLAEPFLPPLRRQVRQTLKGLGGSAILDVGGRHSPYTAGLKASVTVSDLRRATAIQAKLHLGLTNAAGAKLMARRSNVQAVVYDDMTQTGFPAVSFDGVVAVEVLEHVEADESFVSNVAHVLKPGGWFLMTTPNGDYLPKPHNSDHKRHYRRTELETLLQRHFAVVDVGYACPGGALRRWGLRSWSVRRPLVTVRAAATSLIDQYRASRSRVKDTAHGTHHLFALASHPYSLSTVIQQLSSVGLPETAEIESTHA